MPDGADIRLYRMYLVDFHPFQHSAEGEGGYGNGLCPSVFPSVRPSQFCPQNNFKSIQGIFLKLQKVIKDIERKCSVQERNSTLLTVLITSLY